MFKVSLKCGSHSGMIYDTVQILNQENFNFGMYYLSQEKHYISVDISSVFFNPKAVEVKVRIKEEQKHCDSGHLRKDKNY